MKMLTRHAATAAACAAVVLLAASPAAADVKIGSLGAITGPIVSLVKEINAVERAAVAEINAAGGILGQNVALIEADTACSSQTAVDAASKLINVEQVTAIVGALCSGATMVTISPSTSFAISVAMASLSAAPS